MPHADFVHLRVHSAYSLSEGAIKADKIPALALEANMPAVAITDTANLFGALEFSQACAAQGHPADHRLPDCSDAFRQSAPAARSDRAAGAGRDWLDNLQRLSSRGFLDTDPALKPQLAFDDDRRACRRADAADWRHYRSAGASAGGGSEAGGRAPARALPARRSRTASRSNCIAITWTANVRWNPD